MREITLTNGMLALIDDDNFNFISQWTWSYNTGYAVRMSGRESIFMHNIICNTTKGLEVDHIDRNRLNNQKGNLRIGTRQLNSFNRGPQKNNTSGYKGVTRHKKAHKWLAQIKKGTSSKNIGLFNTKEEAAKAYDKKAKELYGEFAYLNFPCKNS